MCWPRRDSLKRSSGPVRQSRYSRPWRSAPVLYNPGLTPTLCCPGWRFWNGPAALLSQAFEGEDHLMLYVSRKLIPAEQHYAAIEREALARKWAVEDLEYYLSRWQFTWVTDHTPLQWMMNAKRLQCTHYSLVLVITGLLSDPADGLSRRRYDLKLGCRTSSELKGDGCHSKARTWLLVRAPVQHPCFEQHSRTWPWDGANQPALAGAV